VSSSKDFCLEKVMC